MHVRAYLVVGVRRRLHLQQRRKRRMLRGERDARGEETAGTAPRAARAPHPVLAPAAAEEARRLDRGARDLAQCRDVPTRRSTRPCCCCGSGISREAATSGSCGRHSTMRGASCSTRRRRIVSRRRCARLGGREAAPRAHPGAAARRGPRRSRAPRRAAAPRPRRRAARRAPGRVQAVRGGGRGGTRRERRHLIAHHTWRRTRSPRRFDSIDNPFCQSVASSSMKNDHTARRRHARRDSHWPANRTTL